MDRSGWVSVCVCSRLLPNIMRLIITPQSFLAFLSLFPPSFIHLSHSLVKGSAANKAHSHAERMWGSTNSHHNYIWFLPYCPLSSAFSSLKHPRCVFLLFAQTSLSSFTHLCRAKFVSLARRPIRASCLLLYPEAKCLKRFCFQGKENIFTNLITFCEAHCNVNTVWSTTTMLSPF